MSDAQFNQFRSRMERIHSGKPKPARVIQRDVYGHIITPHKKRFGLKLTAALRTMVMLFVAFTILKSVLIHYSDRNEYDQKIANLMAGDSTSRFIGRAIGPDYFTKPVGTFIADIAGRIERFSKK